MEKAQDTRLPVQGHFYQVVGQDGKAVIFATAQKKDVLAIATDSDFAMLTGKMEGHRSAQKTGCEKDYLRYKESNLHLPSFGAS